MNQEYYKYLMWILLALNLFTIGGMSNLIAIATNGGKMPIITNLFEANTRTFFTATSSDLINSPELADKFVFFGRIHSLGDIVIYLSFIIMFFTIFFLIKKMIKLRK